MKPALVFSLALTTLAAGLGRPADANGMLRVQQSNGAARDYPQVRIRWTGQTLWLHSADGKGVLEIRTGACSFAQSLMRCLPASMALHQNGKIRPIGIRRGTIYLNLSDTTEPLPYSSRRLAAHSLMGALTTQRGTSITVTGNLDEVK